MGGGRGGVDGRRSLPRCHCAYSALPPGHRLALSTINNTSTFSPFSCYSLRPAYRFRHAPPACAYTPAYNRPWPPSRSPPRPPPPLPLRPRETSLKTSGPPSPHGGPHPPTGRPVSPRKGCSDDSPCTSPLQPQLRPRQLRVRKACSNRQQVNRGLRSAGAVTAQARPVFQTKLTLRRTQSLGRCKSPQALPLQA